MELDKIAVYWAVAEITDNYGQNKVQDPVEIAIRWENRAASNRNPENQVSGIVAFVTTAFELPLNSILWKGRLADYTGSVIQNQQLCEVQSAGNIEDIKGREVRYESSLVRYKGTLAILEPGTGS